MAAKKRRPATPDQLEAAPKKGRPRIEIDKDILKALGAVHCTVEEICAGLIASGTKLDLRTLKRRLQEPEYREIWEQGRSERKISLRRLQWRHANGTGSSAVQMTIHLSKHWLGETDKAALELSGKVDSMVEVNSSARDRINRKLDTLAERITRRVDGLAAAVGAKRAAGESVG